jgi:hypothetical protein
MRKEPAIRQFRSNPILIIHFVVWLALAVYVFHMIIPMVTNASFGIRYQSSENGEVLRIKDFPFHFNFVQKAWRHETTVAEGSSIYSVENHLKVTSEWAGRPMPYSLQFGYSPTMLLVLAPLVPLSPAAAFLLFDIAGLFAVFWMTHPSRCRKGIGLIMFFSPVARFCFYLGQTALLSGAALLFLALKTSDSRKEGWRDTAMTGIVLWAITAKPPVALAAAAVLLGLRRWRTLIAAGVLTSISTLLVSPLLGAHWITDYLHLIGSYNRIDAGHVFAFSVVPEIMGNLRAILSVDIGLRDDVSSLISAAVWLIALASVAITGLRSRVSAPALWAMGILSYLLFCPHVTVTEVLEAVILLPLCISRGDKLSNDELFLFITLALTIFIAPVPGSFIEVRLPLFITELVLFFFFASSGERFASTGFAGEEPPGGGTRAGMA